MKPCTTLSRTPVLLSVVVLAGLALGGLPSGCASERPQAGAGSVAQTARLGTYDSRAVAIAYGRSAIHARHVEQLIATRQKARAEGDAKLAAEMEAAGEAQQVRLHLQAFSNAPVGDALDAVRDGLAGVAERAGVCAIVSVADYRSAGVETVDVTDEVVALFNPDAQTLAIIRDCRKKEPLAIEVVARLPADG
jgi:hypothetical protein